FGYRIDVGKLSLSTRCVREKLDDAKFLGIAKPLLKAYEQGWSGWPISTHSRSPPRSQIALRPG
ncbi:MAG: hypothetical protein VW935_18755, partial [Novosphingobium sp.]